MPCFWPVGLQRDQDEFINSPVLCYKYLFSAAYFTSTFIASVESKVNVNS